jgi:hypothetical protein
MDTLERMLEIVRTHLPRDDDDQNDAEMDADEDVSMAEAS